MIHLQHYKDKPGIVSVHATEEETENYMEQTGGCFEHASSCPCERCKEEKSKKGIVKRGTA